jgi:hypothetical protein
VIPDVFLVYMFIMLLFEEANYFIRMGRLIKWERIHSLPAHDLHYVRPIPSEPSKWMDMMSQSFVPLLVFLAYFAPGILLMKTTRTAQYLNLKSDKELMCFDFKERRHSRCCGAKYFVALGLSE